MNFQENLAQMPDISRLSGLEVLDGNGHTVHHIPAVEGKLGSLKLYNALSERFSGCLNAEAAAQGLDWFAEQCRRCRAASRQASELSICCLKCATKN